MVTRELIPEIRRKLFHLVGLLIPGIYYFIPKTPGLWILGIVCVICFLTEFVRKYNKDFNVIYVRYMKPLLREDEHQSVAGTVQFLTGCWLTVLLFDKDIAIVSISMFIFGDLMAAIVGKIWGKNKIVFNKTLEGTVGGFIAFVIVAVIFKFTIYPYITSTAIIISSIAGMFLELFSKGNWDNFTVPVGIGLIFAWVPAVF